MKALDPLMGPLLLQHTAFCALDQVFKSWIKFSNPLLNGPPRSVSHYLIQKVLFSQKGMER